MKVDNYCFDQQYHFSQFLGCIVVSDAWCSYGAFNDYFAKRCVPSTDGLCIILIHSWLLSSVYDWSVIFSWLINGFLGIISMMLDADVMFIGDNFLVSMLMYTVGLLVFW